MLSKKSYLGEVHKYKYLSTIVHTHANPTFLCLFNKYLPSFLSFKSDHVALFLRGQGGGCENISFCLYAL